MFRYNNKDTRKTLEYFTPCSSVSIVKFEPVNAGWLLATMLQSFYS